MTDHTGPSILRWGPFELDRLQRIFRRAGQPIELQPRAFDVLVLLAERLDQAVSREELLALGWAGTAVVDSVLTQVVRKLRVALLDDPDDPHWLRTVPRFGYRLCGADAAPTLIGRADALGWLRATVAGGARTVTVYASGGTGKTALARAWLHERGGLEVDCGGVVAAAALAARLAGVLGASSHAPGALAAALQAQVPTSGGLLLDDADGLDAEALELVAQLAGERVRLYTAHGPLGLPGEVATALPGLALDVAASWLVTLVPSGWCSSTDAQRIAEAVGGTPLALLLVAARAEQRSAPEVLAHLDGGESLSLLVRSGSGHHDALARCLALAAAQLTPTQAHALRACSCFVGPFSGADAADAFGISEGTLEDLRRRRLLRWSAAGGYTCTGPEREHALILRRAAGDDADLRRSWRRWALRAGRPSELAEVAGAYDAPEDAAAALLMLFDAQGGAGNAWLDALAAGLEQAVGPQPEVDLVRAAWAAGRDLAQARRRCQALCDAPVSDLAARGWLGLAGIAASTADLVGARAAAERATALATHPRTQVRAHTIAGWVATREGRPADALADLDRVALLETDDRTRAAWLSALAAARRALDDAQGAEVALREATRLAIPRDRVLGGLLANLGGLLADRGMLDEADGYLSQAAEIFVADGDRRGEGEACYGLGLVALARGQLAAADTHLRRADMLVRALGDQGAMRRVRALCAALALQRGARVEARLHAQAAAEGASSGDEAALLAWLDGGPAEGSGPWARGARREALPGPGALAMVVQTTFTTQ